MMLLKSLWRRFRGIPEPLPPAPEWPYRSKWQLPPVLAQLDAGEIRMDRDLLIEVIWSTDVYVGPFEDREFDAVWGEGEAWRAEWVRRATPEWIDLLMDLVADPPAGREDQPYYRQQFEELLDLYYLEVAEAHAAQVAERLGALLSHAETRLRALQLYSLLARPPAWLWLGRLLPFWSQLNHRERLYLAAALGSCGHPEARAVLRDNCRTWLAPLLATLKAADDEDFHALLSALYYSDCAAGRALLHQISQTTPLAPFNASQLQHYLTHPPPPPHRERDSRD